MALLAPERHERILAKLQESGTVTVHDLSASLHVTRETIRRDLETLAHSGSLHRVHGGAVVPPQPGDRSETSWHERQLRHSEEKMAIAAAALELIPATETVSMIFDAGTTTEALADLLSTQAPAAATAQTSRFLITNSVPIAQKLIDLTGTEVEMLGGQVRGLTGAVVGNRVAETLAQRKTDIAFIGTNGVDAHFGLSTPDPAEAAVKTALIEAAHRVVVLADGSKLNASSYIQFASLEKISTLITTSEPRPELRQALETAAVNVIVAPTS